MRGSIENQERFRAAIFGRDARQQFMAAMALREDGCTSQDLWDLFTEIAGPTADALPADQAAMLNGHAASPLSPREIQVLDCVAIGMSNPKIARHLNVSPSTIKTFLDRAYEKLACSDRTAAVVIALRRGWITGDTCVLNPACDEM